MAKWSKNNEGSKGLDVGGILWVILRIRLGERHHSFRLMDSVHVSTPDIAASIFM